MTTNRNSSRNRRKSSAVATPTPVVAETTVDDATSVSHERWQQEYGYVFRDLRKLLIVSGALFGVIVVLGFFF
jgi:hypothetical protein